MAATRNVVPFRKVHLEDPVLQALQANIAASIDPIVALLAKRANVALLEGEYTAADVLAKLLTVDGAGSLLDADLLDGQHGAFYRDGSNINAGAVGAAFIDAAIARLASPAFTGNPTAPTPSGGDNDTSIATTAFVNGEIATHAAAADPHTGYQLESGKGASNGYAPLDANALVPAAQSRASTLHADDPFEGNTGGGEDTLGTYTLPGSTVAVGDRLRIFAAMSGNNTDNVTGKFYIGATSGVFISGANQINSGGDLFFYTDVFFTSAGNQVLRGPVSRRTANTNGRVAGTPAEDETGSIVIKITGENTSDSSSDAIILDWWCIEHWRAA